MKILFLAKDSASSKYMINAVSKEYEISKIVFESGVSKTKLLKRRIKKLGVFKVLGQLLFQLIVVKILKISSRARLKEIIEKANFDNTELDSYKIIKVNSVNSDETISLIKVESPDVIVVNGTRILSTKVLESTNAIILNTHVGITPKYRGVHGGYWSLVNKDIENFGVTVHLIDKGIDTGDIIYQDRAYISSKDNFTTYPLIQLDKGIYLMKKALLDIKNNNLKAFKRDLPSKLWSHPTIAEYFYNRIFKNVK